MFISQTIKQLKGKVIISCQAAPGEPFYEEAAMLAMMRSVVLGGAGGLRLAGERDIKNAKKLFDLPVVGITKPSKIPENFMELVYITPTIADAKKVIDAGADIVAFDGTSRGRADSIFDMVEFIKEKGRLSMADVSTCQEGQDARKFGADIISTTLSGYTTQTKEKGQGPQRPDFELLKRLTDTLDCPVILEGRIWSPDDVKKAFELGAWAVVIGSAVTRPHEIVKRFTEVMK